MQGLKRDEHAKSIICVISCITCLIVKKNPIINSKRYTGQQNTWNYYILSIIHVHPDIKRIPWVDL
jgi:hypothetical protein